MPLLAAVNGYTRLKYRTVLIEVCAAAAAVTAAAAVSIDRRVRHVNVCEKVISA
jgi:hypothetical protein